MSEYVNTLNEVHSTSRAEHIVQSNSRAGHFKLKSLFILLGQLLNPKTLYFNFKYLPFSQAVHLPFYVSYKTRFLKTSGKVIINGPVKTGMIRIGFGHVGIFDKNHLRTLIEINGTLQFAGSALIKFGSKISVGPNAHLFLGKNFRISPNSSIVCFKNITIGNNVRISWETILMDTDFHKITDLDGTILNHPKAITIGNNVWIGMRASIMKGTHVYDNVIVGARSYMNKPIRESNCLIAGNPAKVLKRKVKWTP